ncbi:MAG: hypothetical protein Q7S00_05550 [bacterium]|nr:hypothetical protein [bacterium]
MAKARKQFILDVQKIKRAKSILGVATETEAIDTALDVLIGNADLLKRHHTLAGTLQIKDMDQSRFHG